MPVQRNSKPDYLREVDIVRLVTFASVIGVHSVAQGATGTNVASNGVELVLHFTRYAFFTLTGFVLFHTNYERPLDVKRFWSKRFPVVLVPYLVWSVIYFGFWANNRPDLTTLVALQRFGYDLITGAAEYHLYFLLVSMQIYAAFPLLRRLVQKTTGHHRLLLVGVGVTNAIWLWWLHFAPHAGNWRIFADNNQEMITTYLVFVLGGAIAAVHLDELRSWVRSHTVHIGAIAIAGVGTTVASFVFEINHGRTPSFASDPMQPIFLVTGFAIVLAEFALGMAWASKPRQGRAAKLVSEASTASFGIYLAHPLMLNLMANLGFSWRSDLAPAWVDALVSWVGASVLSAVFVGFFIRTPLSMPLTGRVRPKPTPKVVDSPAMKPELTALSA